MIIQTELLGHLNPFVIFLWPFYEFVVSWAQNLVLFRETVITFATNKPRLPPKKPRIDYYKDGYTRSLFFFRFTQPDDENEVFQDDAPIKCFICSELIFFFAAYLYMLTFIESKPESFKDIVSKSTAAQIALDTYSLTRVALDDLDKLVANRCSEFTIVPEQRFAKRIYGTTRNTKSFKVFAALQKSRIDSFASLEYARLMECKS
jgi:hypothetical protein